jgi:hypothetical protein
MTLVGYFNSLRELGGMRRLVDDDIRTRLRNAGSRGFSRRFLSPPYVKEAASPQVLNAFAAIGQLQAFEAFDLNDIWQQIEAKRNAAPDDDEGFEDLKAPEWEAFSQADPSRNNEDFRLEQTAVPQGFAAFFDKVVLVHRLREARALAGITRIQSPGEFGEEWTVPAGRRASLANGTLTWVPAAEVRGEGIFLQSSEAAVSTWLQHPNIVELVRVFLEAHRRWRVARNITPPLEGFPGMRYILLHSFAHLLMRQLALECGYTAASVRGRIYAAGSDAEQGPICPAPINRPGLRRHARAGPVLPPPRTTGCA